MGFGVICDVGIIIKKFRSEDGMTELDIVYN